MKTWDRVCFGMLGMLGMLHAQPSIGFKETLHKVRRFHPELQANQALTAIQATEIEVAKTRANPELNLQQLWLLDRNAFPENTYWYQGVNQQNWWQLTRTFSFPSQRGLKIKTAQHSYAAAEWDYQNQIRLTLQEAGEVWISWWGHSEKYLLLQEATRIADSLAQTNLFRFQQAQISELEWKRTALWANQYALELRKVSQELLRSTLHLGFMMGQKDSILLWPKDDFPMSDAMPYNSLFRPDQKAAHSRWEAAEAKIQYQKSMVIPTPELGFIWNPQNTLPYAGIYATIPLPVLSQNQGEIQKAKKEKAYYALALKAQEEKLQVEIDLSIRQQNVWREHYNAYVPLLAEAERQLNQIRQAYAKGGISLLEVIDAQRSWLNLKEQALEALIAYRISLVQKWAATGQIINWVEE